ncbi:MAG TPA: cytochrome c3 family protein [Thermoanaerobaculia bacterium]
MAQIFSERANLVPAILGAAVAVGGLFAVFAVWYWFSPEYTDVGYQPAQPVVYSHKLHAGELGIDCRYCHSTVERAPVAIVPATSTCMNCHQLVGRDLASVEPLRRSIADSRPLRWVRVHDLPDYVRFDHSLHLAAGVGCSSCHGDVAAMDVVTLTESLSMGWCLECHRDPDLHLRPADELTDTAWQPGPDQLEFARQLRAARPIAPPVDCTGCHQ